MTKKQIKKYLKIERLIIFAAVLEPAFVLPQVYKIFRHGNADGVSVTTWAGLALLTGMWVLYAKKRNDKMLLLYQSLFFTFNSIVTVGAIIY